jgi:hypothetical protein
MAVVVEIFFSMVGCPTADEPSGLPVLYTPKLDGDIFAFLGCIFCFTRKVMFEFGCGLVYLRSLVAPFFRSFCPYLHSFARD